MWGQILLDPLNWYINVATNYETKWLEAKALRTNIVVVTTQFIHENILTRFEYPNG